MGCASSVPAEVQATPSTARQSTVAGSGLSATSVLGRQRVPSSAGETAPLVTFLASEPEPSIPGRNPDGISPSPCAALAFAPGRSLDPLGVSDPVVSFPPAPPSPSSRQGSRATLGLGGSDGSAPRFLTALEAFGVRSNSRPGLGASRGESPGQSTSSMHPLLPMHPAPSILRDPENDSARHSSASSFQSSLVIRQHTSCSVEASPRAPSITTHLHARPRGVLPAAPLGPVVGFSGKEDNEELSFEVTVDSETATEVTDSASDETMGEDRSGSSFDHSEADAEADAAAATETEEPASPIAFNVLSTDDPSETPRPPRKPQTGTAARLPGIPSPSNGRRGLAESRSRSLPPHHKPSPPLKPQSGKFARSAGPTCGLRAEEQGNEKEEVGVPEGYRRIEHHVRSPVRTYRLNAAPARAHGHQSPCVATTANSGGFLVFCPPLQTGETGCDHGPTWHGPL